MLDAYSAAPRSFSHDDRPEPRLLIAVHLRLLLSILLILQFLDADCKRLPWFTAKDGRTCLCVSMR